MNILGAIGLGADLIGVLLLGLDLVRVQRKLRKDAVHRIAKLDAILEEVGGIDSWAETVPSDFRDWHWEEGRAVMIEGTFDARRARESFEEVTQTVSVLGNQVVFLAKMQISAVEADKNTANLSLRLSYIGLSLIVFGFSMQLPGYFINN